MTCKETGDDNSEIKTVNIFGYIDALMLDVFHIHSNDHACWGIPVVYKSIQTV